MFSLEHDVSSRSQLAAACRDQDFDSARHLLAAGANPKGSTCGFFNWTALHFCCQHGEFVFARELIEVYGINPEAEDKEGRTPLHIACQFGHVSIAKYLTSKCKCDPDYLDFEEQTPLHHAVGWLSECHEETALNVAEFLITDAHCDPNRKDINGKNALLHSCEKGFLSVTEYLIDNCGSNITDIDIHGNSCLHLAVSYANKLPMVKYLVARSLPNILSPNGNTVLHAACAANSSIDIIQYLLMTLKCDPNARNENGLQPLNLTTKKEIKRLLYMHGATPGDVLEKHGAVLSSRPTSDITKPALKVLVLGSKSTGKTTLIKTIQREGSSFVFSFSQPRTIKYDEQTKGLQVSDFHNKSGYFCFYDFAGKELYRCSHSALLHHILYCSTATVILVINLCDPVEELKKQIFEWISLINDNCSTVKSKIRIIVIGSHYDLLKYDVSRIWQELKLEQQLSQYDKLDILTNIALDCQRPETRAMTKLRQCLTDTYQQVCSNETIHFNAQCLFDIIETRYIGSLAISVQDLCNQVSVSESSNISAVNIEYYIPNNVELLSDLCVHMNDTGLTMFLHSANPEKALVIINRQLFLNIVAMAITPEQTGNNTTGIICLSSVLPQKCDINVAAGVLMQLELCQAIPINCEIQVSGDRTGIDKYMYFPGLTNTTLPNSVWKLDHKFKCHFGWTLRFGTKISLRIIEILLVRLSSSFFQIFQYESKQFRCWKSVVICSNAQGCEFIAEVNSGAILILLRSISSSLSYLKLRSQLISVCNITVREFCNRTVTEQLFIDPFEAANYPLNPSSFVALFTFSDTAKAIASAKATVKSTTGDELLVSELIGPDPYIDIGPDIACWLTKDCAGDVVISDECMHQIASVMNDNDYLTKLFVSEESQLHLDVTADAYEVLTRWCECAEGTYQSLRKVLSQASVFFM